MYLMGLDTSSKKEVKKILWQLESTSGELYRFSYRERVMLDTFQACFSRVHTGIILICSKLLVGLNNCIHKCIILEIKLHMASKIEDVIV